MSDQQEQAGMASLQDIIMQSLRDVRAGTMNSAQARSVNDLAQTLINSAKVEVEFLRATKRSNSAFFQGAQPEGKVTHSGNGTVQRVANGPWQGLVHRTRDDDDE